MSVQKRGGSYNVRVWRNGRHEWIGSFSTRTHGSASDALLAAREAEIKAKKSTAGTRRETVESFAGRWIESYNKTTKRGKPRWGLKTQEGLRTALKPFVASFGPRRLHELTTPEVRSWAASQPLSYVQRMRNMFNDAMRDGLIDRNPFAALRLEHSRGRRDFAVLTEPQIAELCRVAEEVWPEFGTTFSAMIATAAYTGIRPGEMFALQPCDVNIEACELHVRRSYNSVEIKLPKNGQTRRIVLPPPAGERIARMPRKLTAEWLFETPRGGIFRKSKLDFYFRPVRVTFGRADFPFYGLRHTAATLLLERGMTPELVAFQLGHTDGGKLIRTLYGHPDEDRMRRQLKDAFRNPPALSATRERKAAEG